VLLPNQQYNLCLEKKQVQDGVYTTSTAEWPERFSTKQKCLERSHSKCQHVIEALESSFSPAISSTGYLEYLF
jgi:hypothetical protein